MERSKIDFGAFHLLLPYICTNIIGLPYFTFYRLKERYVTKNRYFSEVYSPTLHEISNIILNHN